MSLCLSTDCVDAFLHSDLTADAVDYEAESWSLAVEHNFCKKQDKRVVKRQDVIYGEITADVGVVAPRTVYLFLTRSLFYMWS